MIPRTSIALLLAVLGITASAAANEPGQITAEPQVVQALADASAYWQNRAPACPAGITVTVADMAGAAADAGGCTITVSAWWLGQAATTRTQWCALFAHEYGHLLGYAHEVYPEDVDHVMSTMTTPHYCLTFNAPPSGLPRACRWPVWARTTPQIASYYAAGKVHAAQVSFKAWRRKHPKGALPRACRAT